jgi:hypothetical protein
MFTTDSQINSVDVLTQIPKVFNKMFAPQWLFSIGLPDCNVVSILDAYPACYIYFRYLPLLLMTTTISMLSCERYKLLSCSIQIIKLLNTVYSHLFTVLVFFSFISRY